MYLQSVGFLLKTDMNIGACLFGFKLLKSRIAALFRWIVLHASFWGCFSSNYMVPDEQSVISIPIFFDI
jgi:hypothetical protein